MYHDEEIVEILSKESHHLEMMFYNRMKHLKGMDNALLPIDLVQKTIEETLKNSRKEDYKERYDIRTLLYLKARNIFSEYLERFSGKVEGITEQVLEIRDQGLDPYERLAVMNDLEEVRKYDPVIYEIYEMMEHGYDYDEISKKMNMTTAGLKMKVYRNKNKK